MTNMLIKQPAIETMAMVFIENLQNQQHQTNIMSNILKTIEEDKTNKQNIMMITLCQLAQKIHCNGILIQILISNESDQKQQQNNYIQMHECRLDQILSILNKKQNRKLNAMESKIYDIGSQLKSHTNILQNIYDEIKDFKAHNLENAYNNPINPSANNQCPSDIQNIINKLKQMDKKISTSIIKSKQIQSNNYNQELAHFVKVANIIID